MSLILGLNHGEINSSAALVRDGQVVAGCPEERFNRTKQTRVFPRQSLAWCLKYAGVELSDCDAVAQAWNPGAYWRKFNPLISSQRTRREDYFYSVPDHLAAFTGRKPVGWVRQEFAKESGMPPVYYVQHHRAHAANAFYLSKFERAAILTCDLRGEIESTTFSIGEGTAIQQIGGHDFPNSLGVFYATFTDLMGYEPDNDEWKVMALSAFDIDARALTERIRRTVQIGPHGEFELDQSVYKAALYDQPKLYTPKLIKVVGGREGKKGELPTDWHYAVGRAMQTVAEEAAVAMLDHLWETTRCPNVAVSGGFFMNSVFNGRLLDRTKFKNLYVSYAPADVGNSIGAALFVEHDLFSGPRRFVDNLSTIGPVYGDAEIKGALERRGITYKVLPKGPDDIGRLLANGEVVAVFNGRGEFGERALGNRSILADPRDPAMKDRINAMIKYREAYRPFAPATLWEKAPIYFEVPLGYECHHMEKVVPVRPEHRAELPAIVHVDGSGRLQTVRKEHNPHFHRIIETFGDATGHAIVLNTSFNVSGDPIVLSPDDALSTFFNSGLKYLALGRFLVSKV